MDIEQFKLWLYRMEHYGSVSGSTVETIIEFIEKQEAKIELMNRKDV